MADTWLRQYVAAEIVMLEHRNRYSIGADNYPFARHDPMEDVWQDCTVNSSAAGSTIVGHGDTDEIQHAQYVGSGLNAFICRPYVSTATAGNYWDISPAADVSTIEETGERWGLTWTRQQKMNKADDSDYVASEWVSKYTLAPNPFMLIGIRRPARPEDCTVEPFTEIHIGEADGKGWALYLPYGDTATWYEKVNAEWVERQWSRGSHHIPEGNEGEEQEIVLMIGVVDGALTVAVMGNGSGDTHAWYRAGAKSDQRIFVESANLRIRHYPGELAVLAQPLYMTDAWVTGPDWYCGVDYGDGDATYVDPVSGTEYYLKLHGWGYSVGEDGYLGLDRCAYGNTTYTDGYAYGSVADAEEDGLAAYHCRWRLHLAAYEHSSTFDNDGTSVTVKSYTTPCITGIHTYRQAILTDGGALADDSDVTDYIQSATIDEAPDLGAVEVRLRAHNNDENSYWAKDIGLLQAFEIRNLRWRGAYDTYPDTFQDEDATVVASRERVWALEPELEGRYADIPCVDLFAVLNLQRVKGQVPIGDSWSVWEYVRHILNLARIGSAWHDLEDTGLSLPAGTASEPAWVPERGRRLGEYLREVVERGSPGGAIWAENGQIFTGCRYCGAKRTSANWLQHQDNGWVSSACLTEDLTRTASGIDLELYANADDATDPTALGHMTQVRAYYATLDDEIFANWVDVSGEDVNGNDLHAAAWDYDSINDDTAANYAGGWVIDHVVTNTDLKTQGLVNREAATSIGKLKHLPQWFTGLVIADGSLRRGYVVSIKGADRLGLHNVKARVAQISLPIIRNGLPLVRIWGRVIGTVA